MTVSVASIDEYVAGQPGDVQAILEEVRRRVHALVAEAGEKMSYGIPTFTLGGRNLVHVGAFKHHIGLYPIFEGDDELSAALRPYRTAKATLRFPLDRPIPYDLIDRVVARLAADRVTG